MLDRPGGADRVGSEEQKRRVLPETAAGDRPDGRAGFGTWGWTLTR